MCLTFIMVVVCLLVRSIALNLIFRAGERTLKDNEVNSAFDAIQKLIIEKTDYLIRK